MLDTPRAILRARAASLSERIALACPSLQVEVIEVVSAVGGGALPLAQPASLAVAIAHPSHSADAIDKRLHRASPPLVGRIADGRLLLDVRTLREDEIGLAADTVAATLESMSDPTTPRHAMAGGRGSEEA